VRVAAQGVEFAHAGLQGIGGFRTEQFGGKRPVAKVVGVDLAAPFADRFIVEPFGFPELAFAGDGEVLFQGVEHEDGACGADPIAGDALAALEVEREGGLEEATIPAIVEGEFVAQVLQVLEEDRFIGIGDGERSEDEGERTGGVGVVGVADGGVHAFDELANGGCVAAADLHAEQAGAGHGVAAGNLPFVAARHAAAAAVGVGSIDTDDAGVADDVGDELVVV